MTNQEDSGEELLEMENIMKMLSNYQKARGQGLVPENMKLEELLIAMKQAKDPSQEKINLPSNYEGKIDEEQEEIIPEPLFVVKTTNDKGIKVFINMCGTPKIPALGDWEKGMPLEVEKALLEMEYEAKGEIIQNIHCPLSCSGPAVSADHCNKLCLVYDVVFNITIVYHAMVHKSLKLFLINLAITWIGQKYETLLHGEFKLPRMKYKGDFVRKHYIKANSRGPLIAEMENSHPSFPLVSHKPIQKTSAQDAHRIDSCNQKTSNFEHLDQAIVEASMKLDTHIENLKKSNTSSTNLQELRETSIMEHRLDYEANELHDTFFEEKILQGNYVTPSSTDNQIINEELESTCLLSSNQEVSHLSSIQKENMLLQHSNLENYNNQILKSNILEESLKKEDEVVVLEDPLEQKQSIYIKSLYNGLPVECTILTIDFAQPINFDSTQIFLNDNSVIIEEMTLNEIIKIPLIFTTLVGGAQACYDFINKSLKITLPFNSYLDKYQI